MITSAVLYFAVWDVLYLAQELRDINIRRINIGNAWRNSVQELFSSFMG
jgi:hypothetical protein